MITVSLEIIVQCHPYQLRGPLIVFVERDPERVYGRGTLKSTSSFRTSETQELPCRFCYAEVSKAISPVRRKASHEHMTTASMVLRQRLSCPASRVLRQSSLVTPGTRRGLAAPSSGTFSYEAGEVSGVKYASRSLAGPTTTLAVVAKAGTRYQPLPGLAEGLEKFAFRVGL